MKAELRRIGESQTPVVIIDDLTGAPERIAGIADTLAPFPSVADSYYPGVRRILTSADADADRYVEQTCSDVAQFIGGAFDIDRFDLIEASFSLVTAPPAQLAPQQRAPHYDTTDQKHLALLHYLRVPAGSGTAFYRQRSTGIERVSRSNIDQFVRTAKADTAKLPADAGYIQGSDDYFEQIGAVKAVPDRLVIYPGSLLHSGIIPPGMTLSADPREGRLTANLFVQGH